MATSRITTNRSRTDKLVHAIAKTRSGLGFVKDTVTGTGVPGLEAIANGLFHLVDKAATMDANRDNLLSLQEALDKQIAAIDNVKPRTTGDLCARLEELNANLGAKRNECESITQKGGGKKYWKSEEVWGEIEMIKTSVVNYISTFKLDGNISIENMVFRIGAEVDAMQAENERERAAAARERAAAEKARTQQILDKLRSAPARYNAANTPDKCTENTRVGIISDLVTRLTASPGTGERIVILSGSAGSGKSTIAKSVAIELHGTSNLAASFFFSRDHSERKEITRLATTLARQLAYFNSDFERLLVKFLDADRNQIADTDTAASEQFQELVVNLLADLPPITTPWVICLDALDECGADSGWTVLRWVVDCLSQTPLHVRLFVTGRPEVFSEDLGPLAHVIVLDKAEQTQVARDIQLYLEHSLDGRNWTSRRTWKASADDITEITKRAAGLFIYAATCVRYIVPNRPGQNPGTAINFLLHDRQPLTSLYPLYHRIVRLAIPKPHNNNSLAVQHHKSAINIVGTILRLVEPLGLRSLAALLDMHEEDLRCTLLPLAAVISIPGDDDGQIHLFHLSFREFMAFAVGEPYDEEKRDDLLCDTEDQRRFVASNILRVMHNELRFNICKLGTSYRRNDEFSDLNQRLEQWVSAQLRYSCRYWGVHVGVTSYIPEIATEVMSFLFDKFLFWLEVLSLLGQIGGAPRTLSTLVDWAAEHTGIVRFSRDARRFISFFADAITQSAPHIYLSALALAPTESEISKQFRPRFRKLVSVERGQMFKWPAAMATLEHKDKVSAVAFSPDGMYVVSGCANTVCVWDAESGVRFGSPLELEVSRGAIQCIAWSCDGKIAFGWDREIGLADAQTMQLIGQHGDLGIITTVVFSPDGKQLVSAASYGEKNLRIWDGQNLHPIGPLPEATSSVFCLAHSGTHIASGHRDGTRIWDAKTGLLLNGPCSNDDEIIREIKAIKFSSDGKRVVSLSNGSTMVWDVSSGARLAGPFKVPTHLVHPEFCSGEALSIGSCRNHDNIASIDRWDAESHSFKRQIFRGHTNEIYLIKFSPDGTRMVTSSRDRTVRIWDIMGLSTIEMSRSFENLPTEFIRSALSRDGRRIVCATMHQIMWFDADSGHKLGAAPLIHDGMGYSLRPKAAFSPDGSRVAYEIFGSVYIWDTLGGERLFRYKSAQESRPIQVAFSEDGAYFAVGCQDATIQIWDVKHPELPRVLTGHKEPVTAVAFSNDGKKIVSGSMDQTLRAWNAENCAVLVGPMQGHTQTVWIVAFCPNDRFIASGSEDHTVRLWDAVSGEPIATYEGHTDMVTCIAFSPSGEWIVSGSDDATLRFWDIEHRELPISLLATHADAIRSITFTPDGRRVVSASADRTVHVWDVQSMGLPCPPSAGSEEKEPVRGHPLIMVRNLTASDSFHRSLKMTWQASRNESRQFSQWKIEQGWLCCCQSELLLWLPVSSRVGFWSPFNTMVISGTQTRLCYDDFVYGEEWEGCYTPST